MGDRPVPHESVLASYDDIAVQMLSVQPHLRAALRDGDAHVEAYPENLDYSFTRQMQTLLQTSPTGTLPDVILFTADSAIPIADTVRGFCYQQKLRTPVLGYVEANFLTICNVNTQSKKALRAEKAEIKRIHKLMPRSDSATCIIDQYTFSGGTIHYAARLAKEAKFDSVNTLAGRWYMNAQKQDIDKRRLTSIHRDFFNAIGRQAARDIVHTI